MKICSRINLYLSVATRRKAMCLLMIFVAVGLYAESLDEYLLNACSNGDANRVQEALQNGANPGRGRIYCAKIPLCQAINKNNAAIVKLLLEAGAPVYNGRIDLWSEPLFQAAQSNRDPAILSMLVAKLDKLPEPDAAMNVIIAPMAKAGRDKELRRIAAMGGKLGWVSQKKYCAPLAAAEGGYLELAKQLIAENKETLRQSPVKQLLAYEIISYGYNHPWQDKDIAGIIHELKALGFHFSSRDGTPFVKSKIKLPELAQALGVDDAEIKQIKPFSTEEKVAKAIIYEDFHTFMKLIDKWSSSPAEKKHLYAVALVSLGDSYFQANKKQERMQALLNAGADINEAAQQSFYPEAPNAKLNVLQKVVMNIQNPALAEWLLQHGADVNYTTNSGAQNFTILDFAIIYGNEQTVDLLLAHGAMLQDRKNNRSALCVLMQSRCPQFRMIPILLKAGADPYFKPEGGMSPVEIAIQKKNFLILRILDIEHREASLLAPYNIPANSPFIGLWTNGESEMAEVLILLCEDGMVIIGGVNQMEAVWRIVADNKAIIESIYGGKKENLLELQQNNNELICNFNGQKQTFKRKYHQEKLPTLRQLLTQPPPKQTQCSSVSWQEQEVIRRNNECKKILADPKSKELNFSDCRLRAIPEEARKLIRATELNVYGNWLLELPDWLSELKDLNRLCLANNAFKSVPPVLRKMYKVRELNLNHNQISSLPPWFQEIGGGKLKYVSLEGNDFSQVPTELFQCAELESIDLSNNSITSIPDALAELPKLKSLNFANNMIPKAEAERFKKLLRPKIDFRY